MSLPIAVNSDKSQASPECHVSKSLDLTQSVPTTGTSSQYLLLQKIFSLPKSYSLLHSPAGRELILLLS